MNGLFSFPLDDRSFSLTQQHQTTSKNGKVERKKNWNFAFGLWSLRFYVWFIKDFERFGEHSKQIFSI